MRSSYHDTFLFSSHHDVPDILKMVHCRVFGLGSSVCIDPLSLLLPPRFAQPPSYTAHITEQQAEEQVAAVSAFASILDSVPSWPQLKTPSAGPSPSSPSEEAPGPGAKLLSLATDVLGKLKAGKATGHQGSAAGSTPPLRHPVWGQTAVPSSDAVMLLKFLLR